MNERCVMAVVFLMVAAGLPAGGDEMPELVRPPVKWSEAWYSASGVNGVAVLESWRTRIGAAEYLELDLWLEIKVGYGFVLNPHFEPNKRYPGRIVVFNDQKEFVGDLLPPQDFNRAGIHKTWCHARQHDILGRRFRISVSDSDASVRDPLVIRSQLRLAPGKYHLQAIYLKSFVSRGKEHELWDTRNVEVLRKLETEHIKRECAEACRSNIVTVEVLPQDTAPPKGTNGMASVRKGRNELAVRLLLDAPAILEREDISLSFRYYNIGDEAITLYSPLSCRWDTQLCGNIVAQDLAGRRISGPDDVWMGTFEACELNFKSIPPMAILGLRRDFPNRLPAGEYDFQMIFGEALLSDNFLEKDEEFQELERMANESSEKVRQRSRELNYAAVKDEKLWELARIEREYFEKIEKRKSELRSAWRASLKRSELFRSNPVRLRVRRSGESVR